MTPPVTPEAGQGPDAERVAPAVFVCASGEGPKPRLETLRKRADFLRAARAGRTRSEAFTLQARKRAPNEAIGPDPSDAADATPLIRIGYTCSKKVGNAVARNRAKRRLREAARRILPQVGQPGWDYVLIGRKDETAARSFDVLLSDLEAAVQRVHRAGPNPNPRHKRAKR